MTKDKTLQKEKNQPNSLRAIKTIKQDLKNTPNLIKDTRLSTISKTQTPNRQEILVKKSLTRKLQKMKFFAV